MPIFAVPSVGSQGIIKDKRPHELPMVAWSDGENVRFRDGFVEKSPGYAAVFGAPTVAPYGLLPVPTPTAYYWMYMGLDKVYAWDGASHTNITRQTVGVDVDYTGAASDVWVGGLLSGIPVITNGVDDPQMWAPVGTGTKLAALSNWPANTKCAIIKPFKQFLVAGDITKSSTRYPYMVKWSHPAAPGTVPGSWDETDATKDAGEYDFAEDSGFVLDMASLRDLNVVYREGSVWAMQFTGGSEIFRFVRLFNSFGALSTNCMVEFVAGKHLVFSANDIVIHDGQSGESILQEKQRRFVFNSIDNTNYRNAFVLRLPALEEVWCCYPETGSTFANKALVWNWRTGALGERDLPNVSAAFPGIILPGGTTDPWSESGTWAADATLWGERTYNPTVESLLMASPADTKLYQMDSGLSADGTAFTARVERTGLGIPFAQGLPPDITSIKFLRNVWPRFEAPAGTVVQVQVGAQMDVQEDVVWQPAQDFTIGQQQKIDCLVSGRLLAVRFMSSTAVDWKLHGYELDVHKGGKW